MWLIISFVCNVNPVGNNDDRIRKQKILHVQVLTLLDRICDAIRNKNVAEMQENNALRKAIFRAAETENVEFLRRMFKANERIAGITNGKDRTVLQYAADYRLEKVYNLIHELGIVYTWEVCKRKDKFDNNMLHIVGSFPSHAQAGIGHIRGAALQMQREVQWYKVRFFCLYNSIYRLYFLILMMTSQQTISYKNLGHFIITVNWFWM